MAHTLRQDETRFNEHWSHWSPYWVAPLDGNIRLEDDTTIDSAHDFRWTPSSNFYISSVTSLTASGKQTNAVTLSANWLTLSKAEVLPIVEILT